MLFPDYRDYGTFKTAGQNSVFSDLADQRDVTATGATVEKLFRHSKKTEYLGFGGCFFIQFIFGDQNIGI